MITSSRCVPWGAPSSLAAVQKGVFPTSDSRGQGTPWNARAVSRLCFLLLEGCGKGQAKWWLLCKWGFLAHLSSEKGGGSTESQPSSAPGVALRCFSSLHLNSGYPASTLAPRVIVYQEEIPQMSS